VCMCVWETNEEEESDNLELRMSGLLIFFYLSVSKADEVNERSVSVVFSSSLTRAKEHDSGESLDVLFRAEINLFSAIDLSNGIGLVLSMCS